MRRTFLLLAAALALAGCAQTTRPTPAPSVAAVPSPTPSSPSGPRRIVITTDMAADDLLAVMAMLREPSVDVLAILVDGNGEVHCADGQRNMRRLLGAFGRTEIPIGCGREQAGPNGRLFPDAWRAGADALYGVELPAVASTSAGADAPVLLAETIAAATTPVTIVPLGPWTIVADVFAADPSLATRVAGIHAMAGAIDVPGNIAVDEVRPEHGVEWNVGVDPDAFAAVLETAVPVTLVPLDATNDVPVPADFAAILEPDHAAAGADIAYEMFLRSPFLTQDTSFWDTLAVMALVDPGLVEWEDLTARVEIGGPSSGRIVRDESGRPLRAAMSADRDAFMSAFLAALRRGEPRPEPFTLAGTVQISWDGATCRIEGEPPAAAGITKVTFTNRSKAPAGVLAAGVMAPRTWSDVVMFAEALDLSDPDPQLPDWIIEVPGSLFLEAGQEGMLISPLPAGEVGVLCATGEWPALELHDGGSFTVSG